MGLLNKEIEIKLEPSDIAYFDASDLGIYFSTIADDETFIETINWLIPQEFTHLLIESEAYAETELTEIGKENLRMLHGWIEKVLGERE